MNDGTGRPYDQCCKKLECKGGVNPNEQASTEPAKPPLMGPPKRTPPSPQKSVSVRIIQKSSQSSFFKVRAQ